MNIKRIFGALLTVFGSGSLVYAAIGFMKNVGGDQDIKTFIIFGGLGLLFFIAGIGLIRTTADTA